GGEAAVATDSAPRAGQSGAGPALQARKLVSDATAATMPPRLIAPAPQLETAAASAEIEGQKLERRDPVVAAASLPPAPAALGLLLLAAFFAGMLRSKRIARRVTAPISMENPA
ncbi:MAG: hypothetical protein H7Z39_06930, partial [Burkholderiaceae bacterium]|nr:hypothetical protein [Burkholderiaceae bacterium]